MAGPTEDLIVAAFDLSKACPREWEAFIKTLDLYVADTIKRLMSADPPNLANYQGQAVQAQHLFHLLADSRQTMQKVGKIRNAKPEVSKTPWPS